MNTSRKSSFVAQRYFCPASSFVGKLVPDFVLPGNFLHKQASRAQVTLRGNGAHESKISELALQNF